MMRLARGPIFILSGYVLYALYSFSVGGPGFGLAWPRLACTIADSEGCNEGDILFCYTSSAMVRDFLCCPLPSRDAKFSVTTSMPSHGVAHRIRDIRSEPGVSICESSA